MRIGSIHNRNRNRICHLNILPDVHRPIYSIYMYKCATISIKTSDIANRSKMDVANLYAH